ncbi:MAG TPA: acireductone dioxygenase [bacterium]|nr:acireductone dioxygenase [bacterium]
MSELRIYHESTPTQARKIFTRHGDVAETLKAVGIRFERWDAGQSLTETSTGEEIIAAYRDCIERLKSACGFRAVDVIRMFPEHPEKDALRAKFLREHIHTEDEIRFFVEGGGLFFLHIGEHIYAVDCEKSDLISVPAGTKHWFDAGPNPHFTAIRFFTNPEGWVAQYTDP